MLLLAFALAAPLTTPPPSRAQGVDVYINITGGGTKKLNIAIPEFTVTTGTDPAATGKLLASVARSEERRVGKECRARVWRRHKTTNGRPKTDTKRQQRIREHNEI